VDTVNLCSRCGVELHHDVEHDTANEKDLVRWWCPDHCPQCKDVKVEPFVWPALPTPKAPPVCKKTGCSADRYYPTARGVKVDGFCVEHSTIDIEFVTALGHWQQHLKRVTAAIKEDGSDRDKPGQPMNAESLLSMQHRHYAELRRLTAQLFGNE
jgi:hypothetical protein